MRGKLIHAYLVFLLFVYGGAGVSLAQSSVGQLENAVETYFSRQLHIPAEKLSLSLLRVPRIFYSKEPIPSFRVFSQKSRLRLGYQTVWVELYTDGKKREKLPVTVSLAAEADVLVASRQIDRHERLNRDNTKTVKRMIKEGWDDVLSPDKLAVGYESRRIIQPGEIITRGLVRKPPVIRKGEQIKIKIQAGTLVVIGRGKARQDGGIGDEIVVKCEPGGKKIKAIVERPGLAVINQESGL